jgi:hypothetical protein
MYYVGENQELYGKPIRIIHMNNDAYTIDQADKPLDYTLIVGKRCLSEQLPSKPVTPDPTTLFME